mgnify:CR=1 FL=1
MKHYPEINKIAPALIFLIALASCTTTTIDEFRQGETGIENDESVVILGRREASDYETRSEFVNCVGERMTRGEDAITIIPEQNFLDAMFPHFEPRTAPQAANKMAVIMDDPLLASKITELGIRYIVWLDGSTETTDRSGSISCTVGPGGAGCFGFGTWEDDANFDAQVWDVGSSSNVGAINTDATGQSYLPALVIPIPLIARVEANACSRLATQLKEFVNGS